ncbi:hypothetical protein L1049_000888 [Liquidambar formosana]|uniref:BSD domain-containing protein n=1 Tax=Liquidambar formosana TaxID=63359 RepID=A0AAP0NDM2_LIQFO
MSWLSIPLPNPFKSLQSDDLQPHIPSPSPDQDPSHGGGGVKEDLSVLGETIGRQLRGVASFLAPPPSSSATTTAAAAAAAEPVEESSYDSSSQALLGIRNDLVEIGGSFKSGLSLLSGNKAVSGISRLASNLLQLGNEDDDDDGGGGGDEGGDWDEAYGGVAGITEEVVDFAREISTRPECWIDFPLSLDNDFNMSDAQREHASTIERLAPRIAALRVKLRSDMSDELFWMIYFILLLPRLDEHDTKLLSTPEIVEARAILLQKLQTKSNSQVNSERSKTLDSSQVGSETRGENSPMQEKEVLADTVKAAQVAEMDEQEHIESG